MVTVVPNGVWHRSRMKKMKPVSALEYFLLSTLSKPVENRLVYKTIKKNQFRSIIEVGLGDGSRSEKIIRVAKKFAVSSSIRYTGVDLFEGRDESQSELSLRQMHKRLSSSDAKVQLVPGDLYPSLTRIANSHVRTDLILISAGYSKEDLAPCWFYFPRMLHAGSKFMIQTKVGEPFKLLTRLEIEKLVEQNTVKQTRRAA